MKATTRKKISQVVSTVKRCDSLTVQLFTLRLCLSSVDVSHGMQLLSSYYYYLGEGHTAKLIKPKLSQIISAVQSSLKM